MPGLSRVSITLADAVTATGAQPSKNFTGYEVEELTFQATVQGTGAVTATVQVEVSNDNIGWLVDSTSTLSLSGTNIATAGFTSSAPWQYARANITALTGTNARVTVTVGG